VSPDDGKDGPLGVKIITGRWGIASLAEQADFGNVLVDKNQPTQKGGIP